MLNLHATSFYRRDKRYGNYRWWWRVTHALAETWSLLYWRLYRTKLRELKQWNQRRNNQY